MNHTHIVPANELEKYAETRDSEAVIPELLFLLVEQSVPNASQRRIPYGDAVNQPGKDGIVEDAEGFAPFVPAGVSYWEIGTGSDPQEKATRDFRKRTDALSESERAEATFVFLTPRSAGSGGWSEPAQAKWIDARRSEGWKDLRIIDGVTLADWLRQFPALGRWMATKVGLSRALGELTTPAEHWEETTRTASSGPSLPAKLFTEGRESACEALKALFEGTSQQLRLLAESPQDVFDFVAGYLQALDSEVQGRYARRCLFVSGEDAWRSIAALRKPHVLVADRRLDLESDEGASLLRLAIQKGHAVVVPLCGASSTPDSKVIRLRSPSEGRVERVLRESGFTDVQARELASVGGGRLSALRRSFQGLGTQPAYAKRDSVRFLAQAGLAGKWNANNAADRTSLETLSGRPYPEWIEPLRADALLPDSPLTQRDERWRLVARGEAWNVLGSRITDEDLDRLRQVAIVVLGERNPSLDLPKEERFAAALRNKALVHSQHLREGIAETLALMGSRSEALSSCSRGKPDAVAVLVVRELLKDAPWDRWASLDPLLPLLAEAAPGEFLDAVEGSLRDVGHSPFHQVFAQEGSGFTGRIYMTGLLWALETLAWSPDFLCRVALVLADLASIDPGGQHSNRPSNSLLNIFLPWHFQTSASLERRRAAVEAVLREQPVAGWNLLLGLLPESHGLAMGCRQPTWRRFVPPEWTGTVLMSDYWMQIEVYADLALNLAKASVAKLEDLVDRCSDLHEPAQQALLEHLSSPSVVGLPEHERVPLWEKLQALARRHRRFPEANWALASAAIARIESCALALAPAAPALEFRRLFGERDHELFEQGGDFEEQERRLDEARRSAVKAILDGAGLVAVFAFAQSVARPDEVGSALGRLAFAEVDAQILPSMLGTEDAALRRFLAGFVWARRATLGWDWVDRILAGEWSEDQRCSLLVLLPFVDETWHRAAQHLGEEGEGRYWKVASVNPYGPDRDLKLAIDRLVRFGRADAAISCIDRTIKGKPGFDAALAARALTAILDGESAVDQLDHHATVEVINQLQETPGVDPDVLFRIEWNFLRWLGRHSAGTPRTLDRRLASDPAFFAEVVALVFRSRKEQPPEEPPSEQKQAFARNAYELLHNWHTCPGKQADGSFDEVAFRTWIAETARITTENGRAEVAQSQIGQMLTHAPPDPGGLWIHEAVASALNDRDAEHMRSGFTTALYNQRGVHGFTEGKEEREIATRNRAKADALDEKGYARFAAAMREFAAGYERDADRAAERDPFDDD